MDFIDRNLEQNEKIVLKAKVSWFALTGPAIWAAIVEALYIILKITVLDEAFKNLGSTGGNDVVSSILSTFLSAIITVVNIVPHIIAAFPLITKAIKLSATKLAVTDKRILGKKSGRRAEFINIRYDKLNSVFIKDDALGGIFKYGTVTLAGNGFKTTEINCIASPKDFKDKADEAMANYVAEERRIQAEEIASAMKRMQDER